jgi:tRNA G18 (ribose-2'-O)-methylase SpoU
MVSQRVKNNKEVYLILHNIRSVYNVGSIFRTAEAAGVKEIFLTGYSPSPLDKFGNFRKDIKKTALGTEKKVSWEKIKDIKKLLDKLKKQKIKIIALEQSAGSLDYKKFIINKPTAVLVGNEVRGVSSRLLTKMDKVIEIPMMGNKESLNVSVACGVALFRILDI